MVLIIAIYTSHKNDGSYLVCLFSMFLTKQTNLTLRKEHVKISNTAKFQSCMLNTREMTD